MLKFLLVIILFCATAVQSVSAEEIYIRFGNDIPESIQKRFLNYINPFHKPRILHPDATCPGSSYCSKKNVIVFSLGHASHSPVEKNPESYEITQKVTDYGQLITLSGQAASHLHSTVNTGLLYGLYDLLEQMGYRFLHPFQPTVPKQLNLTFMSRKESPYWSRRGISLHTMHPLEMTHGLNGWGLDGPHDKASWLRFLKDWESYQEWLIANKQNMVQWVLLEKDHWLEFSRSHERKMRLSQITAISHQWGIQVGVDVPIVLEQQNAWRLIRKPEKLNNTEQLKASLDWLMGAKFDFLTTEMGFSEFHHPVGRRYVELAQYQCELFKKQIPDSLLDKSSCF